MLKSDVSYLLAGSLYGEAEQKAIRARMAKRLDRDVPADEPERARRSDLYRLSDYSDYQDMEALIEAVLLEDMSAATRRALDAYNKIVAGGQVTALPAALDAFENLMRSVFTNNTEQIIERTVRRLVDRGALVAGLEQGLRDTIAKNDVIEGIMDSAKWYTNNHFDRAVMPEIYAKLDDIAALNLAPTDHLAAVRNLAIEGVDKNDWKLRITANGAASKGYHYGVVKGGWDAGFRTYRFTAILDDATSEVCTHMNGKEFQVADAVSVAERRTQGTPEEVAEFAPWFKIDDVYHGGDPARPKDNVELAREGILLPPLHANCRSSIYLA